MISASCNNQNSNPNDPEWHFLGEYPLKGLEVKVEIRDEPNDGMLFKTIRDLGIGAELIDSIERKLIGYISGAITLHNEGRIETTATIRLFCQKETVEDGDLLKSSSQLMENQATKNSYKIRQSDPAANGGWGYFLVKRGGDPNPASSVNTDIRIDLFLYQE